MTVSFSCFNALDLLSRCYLKCSKRVFISYLDNSAIICWKLYVRYIHEFHIMHIHILGINKVCG